MTLERQRTEWMQKGQGPPKKKREMKFTNKTLVIIFFYYRGLVYTHTCVMKTTINVQYYMRVLKQLMKDHIPKKRPDLIRKGKLQHDEVRPSMYDVIAFLAKKKKSESNTTSILQFKSGSQWFLSLPRHKRGAEKKAFSDQNGCCKGFADNSQVYG